MPVPQMPVPQMPVPQMPVPQELCYLSSCNLNALQLKLALMERVTEELIQSGIAERSLKVGDRISDFSLPNALGKTVELKDLLKRGSIVIAFYRGVFYLVRTKGER